MPINVATANARLRAECEPFSAQYAAIQRQFGSGPVGFAWTKIGNAIHVTQLGQKFIVSPSGTVRYTD